MNPKIDSVSGVEDTHLRLFGGGFTFLRLSLPKISDWFGGLPEWIVQGSVKLWSAVNAYRFRYAHPFLR
jgi:hypothetical protein